jgi:hypothetical protein
LGAVIAKETVLLISYKCLPFRLMSHFFGHTSFKKVICSSLSNIGINVILEWKPSHVGILGNELADKEAKHSLSLKNIYVFNPLKRNAPLFLPVDKCRIDLMR